MQWEAIEVLVEAAKQCPEVKAVFLKGSLAQGTADEYSDVDFYCLVDAMQVEQFLRKRLELLEKYRPLIFHNETNFVGPQIVAVFDNGLHFDLYTVTPDAFPRVGHFRALYDPDHLLQPFAAEMTDHSLPWEQVERCFDSFSFGMLEFHAAWRRGDVTWSARLASHLAGELCLALRHRYDPSNGQLGAKRLETVLPVNVRERLRNALSFCCGDMIPHGVLMLAALMRETMEHLEAESGQRVNWQLFRFMVERLDCSQCLDGNRSG